MDRRDLLTIGEMSARSGLAPSALRYYESVGLIASTRTGGDRRRYRRAVLRRVAVIRAAQQVGLSLEQVRTAFARSRREQGPSRRDAGNRPLFAVPQAQELRHHNDLRRHRTAIVDSVHIRLATIAVARVTSPNATARNPFSSGSSSKSRSSLAWAPSR